MIYRKQLFSLCTKLLEEEFSSKLESHIVSIYENQKGFFNQSILLQSTRRDLDYFGILLTNEEVEKKNSDNPILNSVTPFDEEQKKIFSIAHSIMEYFINECFKKIGKLPYSLKLALNPFYKYASVLSNPVKLNVSNHIDVDLFKNAVNAFEETLVVKLIQKEVFKFSAFFETTKTIDIYGMLEVIGKNIRETGFNEVPKDLENLENRIYRGNFTNGDDLFRFFYLCFALRELINASMDTISMSLKRKKIGVVNENTIISVKSTKDLVRHGKEFLLQPSDLALPAVGNLSVIDYTMNGTRTKEFGYCIETSHNFISENGDTFKCKLNIVDEDLNQYTYLNSLYKL